MKRNALDAGLWDLLVDSRLICAAFCADPWDGARRANKNDFGDESITQFFKAIHVPDDLDLWSSREPSETVQVKSIHDEQSSCKSRPWKPGNSGRLN